MLGSAFRAVPAIRLLPAFQDLIDSHRFHQVEFLQQVHNAVGVRVAVPAGPEVGDPPPDQIPSMHPRSVMRVGLLEFPPEFPPGGFFDSGFQPSGAAADAVSQPDRALPAAHVHDGGFRLGFWLQRHPGRIEQRSHLSQCAGTLDRILHGCELVVDPPHEPLARMATGPRQIKFLGQVDVEKERRQRAALADAQRTAVRGDPHDQIDEGRGAPACFERTAQR